MASLPYYFKPSGGHVCYYFDPDDDPSDTPGTALISEASVANCAAAACIDCDAVNIKILFTVTGVTPCNCYLQDPHIDLWKNSDDPNGSYTLVGSYVTGTATYFTSAQGNQYSDSDCTIQFGSGPHPLQIEILRGSSVVTPASCVIASSNAINVAISGSTNVTLNSCGLPISATFTMTAGNGNASYCPQTGGTVSATWIYE